MMSNDFTTESMGTIRGSVEKRILDGNPLKLNEDGSLTKEE